MIRDIQGIKCWVSVISANRQHRVLPMQQLVGNATWYVPKGLEGAYGAAGAADVKGSGGGLVGARNDALHDAWRNQLPCVQMSDDLKRLAWAPAKETWHDMSFDKWANILLESLYESRYKLAGCAPTFNAYFADMVSKTSAFIVGDMIAVLPCGLYFDSQFKLKEDYDYTCQHYVAYGGALRVAHLMADFAHRTNEGGAVDVRTPELEQDMIARLKAKWPDWIVDNPRRDNEVLLRLPKRQREVLG